MQLGQTVYYGRTLVVLKLEPNVTAHALMFRSWRAYQIACSCSEVITPGNKYVRFFNKTSAST